MLNNRVELLWGGNYRRYFFLLLFLSFIIKIQCQIIRKSVELPVKDYISAPKRNSRDDKDHLYVQGSNIDSVRNFEILSPHTPASALMFASLAKSSSQATPSSTLLRGSTPKDGSEIGRNSLPKLFNPAVSSSNVLSIINRNDKLTNSLFSRNQSPSTDLLEDGLNKATKGYSFSFSDPPSDTHKESGSQGVGQEFIPVYNTPFPSFYQNNDAALGYLNKFSNILPVTHDGVQGRNIDSFSEFSQHVSPSPMQYVSQRFEGQFEPIPVASQPYKTPRYRQQDRSVEYDDYSSRERKHNTPRSKEISKVNKDKAKSDNYYDKSHEILEYDGSRDGSKSSLNGPNYDTKQAPYVPPTVGVIGWKSNTDHETSWKPTKALMNMADQHITEDMKNKGYMPGSTTPIPPSKEINEGDSNNNKEEAKEEDKEEEEESEEGGEEEEEEEESEEEEEEENESEEEETNGKEPLSRPPQRYENSAENYREPSSYPPPKYGNSAETLREHPSYQKENYREEPSNRPPPRYENSSENYRDPPSYPPSRYENSAETLREHPSYQKENYREEPPHRPPPRHENSAETLRGHLLYKKENYREEPPHETPPRYENSAETLREHPSYQKESYREEPPYRPPPRYENSAENYRDQPSYPPPRHEDSAETLREPPSYQKQNYEKEPPYRPPIRHENAVKNYRDSPSNPDSRYENSAEHYHEPSLRPPQKYELSSEHSREPSSRPLSKYGTSGENFREPLSNPTRNENSAKNYDRPTLQSSLSYDNSPENQSFKEYNKQYQNNDRPPLKSEQSTRNGEYSYDGQTLPPGPPYNPPSYAHYPGSSFGYLAPPPSFQPVSLPIDLGVRQTWTPIIPTEKSISSQENKNIPEYKSENGRWLLNGGPILKNDFGEYNFGFQNWDEFGKEKISNQVEGETLKQYTKPGEKQRSYREKSNGNSEDNERAKVESNHLPVEHRENEESVEDSSRERKNSEESSKEADPENEPPPPPRDLDEERVRNHVSDREKPRKVPTRLRYPGGGLWAKPRPDSGIDLGFVPKKVYTQTRKHNVVKHLPREAALASASTAEEVVNAPRLREVVSHKKVQEVYEEEGYEDSGYDHGGYKKHGASKSDTDKYNSGEHHSPAEAAESEAPSPEETYEEHLRHLEEIPEDTKGDPTGEGSMKQPVQVSEKPKVKGSWKQHKTTTNERSLAFLDEEGKGGILTEKHPTRVEGVEGKYLDVNGKRVPVVKEITDSPIRFINHGEGVSFQRYSPTNVRTDQEKEVVYNKYPEEPKTQDSSSNFPRGYISESYAVSRDQMKPESDIKPSALKNTAPNTYNQPQSNLDPIGFHYVSLTDFPQLASYTSRNNRFSFIQPQQEKPTDNIINYFPVPDSPKNKEYEISDAEKPTPTLIYDSETLSPKSGFFRIDPGTESYNGPNLLPKYSARFTSSKNENPASLSSQNSLDTGRLYEGLQLEAQSKERRSRDLTAVGVDGVEGELYTGDFSHPTAALRAIEDQITLISTGSFDRSPRSRSRNSDAGTMKRYKEIVRAPSQTQDDSFDDKKDKINVRVTNEDVNIRHPFLPRDGSGDIKIDYVKIRKEYDSTTSPPRIEHFIEDVEFASVTEETTTTATPKVTTTKSKTTTEYVPEDPSQTLSRLKTNPFLSSIFQGQENQEEKTKLSEEIQTTTTPKITTYRAKTTSEESIVPEEPEDSFHRLKSNPFLSTVLSNKEEKNKHERNQQAQMNRGSTIRPIIVLPEESDKKPDPSVKHVEQLTLAHYSKSNNGLLYQQVPMRTRQRISNLAQQLNSEGVDPMHIVVRRSADSVPNQTEKINVAAGGTTTDIPVDTEKYPFYYSPATVSFPKYSPLRYATSPKDIPDKTDGGMEFYESRDKEVRCEEPTPPKNIVPKREKEGEWNKNPQPERQRMGKLGDQIDCLKAKYFGEDPLDNPFFKEEDVGVPDFTTQSPDDSFGFYSDIIQNIKSNPENDGEFFKSSNNKREIGLNLNSFGKSNNDKRSDGLKKHTIKKSSLRTRRKESPLNETPKQLLSDYQESRISNKIISPIKINKPSQDKSTLTSNKKNNENNETRNVINKTPIPPFSEIHTGSSGPIRLHPPKNVIVSFRSKGTANHPKIKVIKGTASLYNVNVKIVPMSSVGYLKAHSPVHIHVEDLTSDKSHYLPDPLYELDPISSAASQIAKLKKTPTTVTYLTMNPEGKLIHQHIRTFIPVSKKAHKEKENTPEPSESVRVATLWDLPLHDERRSESKYRVKRQHENDKYINSRESMELKNFLLHKYAEILAKEKEEANRQKSEKEKINENLSMQTRGPISTSRNTEGFAHGSRPQYSSRYRASGMDPMHHSPSTEVKVNDLGNSTQQPNRNLPFRKPKVRFPKLTMTSRSISEGNRTKFLNLPEPIPVRLITTTTTTTTEPPPSTTTRMYKPKVVYKKEYGKPIQKVVDMFAVLKRHPSLSTEQTTTTTDNLPIYSEELPNLGRRVKPKRLQQFEHRTITKEEVIRRTYTPESESRSDKARTFDSIYDHPDLRGPNSRKSRDAEQEDYQEMLVYMVNPTTGVGEWTLMPIPAKAVSRMDNLDFFPEKRSDKVIRRSKTKSHSRSNRENLDLGVRNEPRTEENTTETDEEVSTSIPKKAKSKTRRKSSRRHKEKVYLSSNHLRSSPSTIRSDEEVTTPKDFTPADATLISTATSGTSTNTDTAPVSTSTRNPRIIMEPHKRKYFYAKI